MKNIILSLILLIVVLNNITAQRKRLIPKKGIEGINLSIGNSNLDDVVKIFGEPDEVFVSKYIYKSIGLTFQIKQYDKNKIIRSIYIEAPFQGQTEEGIILGKSTMQDVFDMFPDNKCYSSGGQSWNPQDGITFYVKSKKIGYGCNYNKKIYLIELHEDNGREIISYKNYEFDDKPIIEQKNKILTILQAKPFDKTKFDQYFQEELQNDEKIYGIKKRNIIDRKLDHEIIQEKRKIEVGNKEFTLLLLSRNSKMLYTKFYNSYDVFTEHLDTLEFNKIQELRRNENLREINLKEAYDFPNDIYTYGMFCGFGGSPPSKCLDMLNLVNTNNYDSLINWSTSLNPEIAAYGYTGLYFLQEKGYSIQVSEKELFTIISQKTTIINMCRGCYLGVKSSMKEELSDKKLSLYYKAFKETGWIRNKK